MKKRYEGRPIEVLIPETRAECDTVQRMVVNLKRRLRDALEADPTERGFRAIVADRAQFKTTALVQFVAERQMNVNPPIRVGVLCPNQNMVRLFTNAYQTEFPTLRVRNPLVATPEEVIRGRWAGEEVNEVYADEIFMMNPHELRQIPGFVCGIGTLMESPVLIRISSW